LFLAGPSVFLFAAVQRAQDPKAPGGLVFVALMVLRIIGGET